MHDRLGGASFIITIQLSGFYFVNVPNKLLIKFSKLYFCMEIKDLLYLFIKAQ